MYSLLWHHHQPVIALLSCRYTFVENVQNPHSVTILIKGPSDHVIAQIKVTGSAASNDSYTCLGYMMILLRSWRPDMLPLPVSGPLYVLRVTQDAVRDGLRAVKNTLDDGAVIPGEEVPRGLHGLCNHAYLAV
jgi:T-complex protein 1 subunit zeta